MSAQTDFQLTIKRAAGLAVDAGCAARSAGQGPLPPHVRRLVRSATRNLERANADLYEAHHARWEPQPSPRQLELTA
jgi:hypothetical protein